MNLQVVSDNDGNFDLVCLVWDNLDAVLQEMHKSGYRNVSINDQTGWVAGKPLDFLYENDWIEGIEVIGEDCDISPIRALKKLKYLRLTSNKLSGSIDFSGHTDLQYLSIWWQKGRFINLKAASNMEFIYITGFSMESLALFENFHRLKDIRINLSKLQSLSGIENCKKLERIDIFSAQRLTSIDLQDEIAANIKLFSLDKCKLIKSYKVIEKMENLESLYIDAAAPIHSVAFLKNMKKLRYAYIGVDILDRDVAFLRERGFEFKNARSYNWIIV